MTIAGLIRNYSLHVRLFLKAVDLNILKLHLMISCNSIKFISRRAFGVRCFLGGPSFYQSFSTNSRVVLLNRARIHWYFSNDFARF